MKKKKEIIRKSFPIRICAIQYKMRKVKSFESFEEQCKFFVDVAADYDSDFAVFPELITTQLLSIIDEKDTKRAIRKIASFTPRYIKMFKKLAKDYEINIVAGSHFIEEKGKIYNASFLFRKDGTYDTQKKIHVTPSESQWWGVTPGSKVKVFDTDCGKISVLTCYDIEFPELPRIVIQKGANIIFNPYSTDDRHGYIRVINCAKARAIENQCYVVSAGIVGNLVHVKHMDDIRYASTGIYTPSDLTFPRDGIAGECAPNIETVVIADVDLDLLAENRKKGTVTQLKDIRRDLYEIKLKK